MAPMGAREAQAKMPISAKVREAGYTLAELLVVLAILAMMGGVLMGYVAQPGAGTLARAGLALAGELKSVRLTALLEARELTLLADQGALIVTDGRTRRELGAGNWTAQIETDASRLAPAIRFFADGTSTGGAVLLEDGDQTLRIRIAPVTGHVAIEDGS